MTTWLIAGAAALQLAVSVVLTVVGAGDGLGGAAPLVLSVVVAFTLGAGFLLGSGRSDDRAVTLGALYAAVATTFAWPSVRAAVPGSDGALVALFTGVGSLRPEALVPHLLWLFVADFPRVDGADRLGRLSRAMARWTLALGAVLVVGNLLAPWAPSLPALDRVTRFAPGSVYWLVVLTASLPALIVLPLRGARASRPERRRVRILLLSTALGAGPIVVFSILDALGFMQNPTWFAASRWIAFPALIAMPLATAYAVLVHRALDVRLILRQAIKYALARYTLLAATGGPIAFVAVFVFLNRGIQVGDLFSGFEASVLAVLAVTAALALRWRERLLVALDRRFFREQYNAQRILRRLVDDARSANSASEISRLLVRQLDQALHPTVVLALVANRQDGWLAGTTRRVRPLAPHGPMVEALVRERRVYDVASGRLDPDVEERAWLEAHSVHLLAPMLGKADTLLGLVALGERRSELPYTSEDRELIGAVAGAAAAALENTAMFAKGHWPGSGESPPAPEDPPPARECACGSVQGGHPDRCPQCGEALRDARIPAVVGSKFRVTRRLGSGSEGAVYLAHDDTLGRDVALKGLHTPSAASSIRLQREARALAAVSHPHLAVIYGTERWGDAAFLVLEYLPGGTLARRLKAGPLPVEDVIRLGAEISDALVYLHGRDLLHRDIKPSNVGFAKDGRAKLLDFGLAQLAAGPDPEQGGPPGGELSMMRSGPFPGTIPYLSPETIEGAAPAPRDDLWSFAILMCEAVSGVNPFRGRTAAGTLARILQGQPEWPDPSSFQGASELESFLVRSLSPDPNERPQSAAEVRAVFRGLG